MTNEKDVHIAIAATCLLWNCTTQAAMNSMHKPK